MASTRAAVLSLADCLEALPRHFKRLIDDGGWDGERVLWIGTVEFLGVAVGGLAVGGAGGGGVAADVVEDAAQQRGERCHFAGAQEREGVGLDGGGPVRRVGVEGIEEGFLDSGSC